MDSEENIILQEIGNRGIYCCQLCSYLDQSQNSNSNHEYQNSMRVFILQKRIATIDSWIGMLPNDEAFIIREHIAYCRSMETVRHRFQQFFRREIDDEQIMRYQSRALRRISLMVGDGFSTQEELLQYMNYGL